MDKKGSGGPINAFSGPEAGTQSAFSAWRQRLFRPLLKRLAAANVSPDVISLFSIVSMVFLPLGFIRSPLWVVVAYLLHLFFDGLDGSLARYRGTASPRGAYLDVVVDHFALLATLAVLQWFGYGSPFWVLLYTVCYLVLVVHFVLMNAQGNPPTFPVVRSKYLLFALTVLVLFGVLPVSWFTYFFVGFGLYYLVMVVVYIALFRWSLPATS